VGLPLPRWIPRYLGNLGVAVSQLGNALRGGSPNETGSSAIGRAVGEHGVGPVIARVLDSGLDKLEPGHAEKTAALERELLEKGEHRPETVKDRPGD